MSATKVPLFENFLDESLVTNAREICRQLQIAGFEAFFVGGCVRDAIIYPNEAPLDIDICTSALPEQIKKVFPQMQFVGQAFGVCMVKRGPHTYEVATFRKDGSYSNRRHPDTVESGTHFEDSLRRDFTINALYFDPIGKDLVDFHGGQDDIALRLLRCVGTADDRLREDALRILRLFRFAARFGFSIEKNTALACFRQKDGLNYLSHERIVLEIIKVKSGKIFEFTNFVASTIGFEWLGIEIPQAKNEPIKEFELLHQETPLASFMLAVSSYFAFDSDFVKKLGSVFCGWPTTRIDTAVISFFSENYFQSEFYKNKPILGLIFVVSCLKRLANVSARQISCCAITLMKSHSMYFSKSFLGSRLCDVLNEFFEAALKLSESADIDFADLLKLKRSDVNEIQTTRQIVSRVEQKSLPKKVIANWVDLQMAACLMGRFDLLSDEGMPDFLERISES